MSFLLTHKRFGITRQALPIVAGVIATVMGGCSRTRVVEVPAPPPPAPALTPTISPWPGVLAAARRFAEAGRYHEADSLLAAFALSRPNTPEGAESDFWRALFKADPSNERSSAREALAALDAYLGGGPSLPRHGEAVVLRRMVETLDSARVVISAVRETASVQDRARAEQVKRLSEELEKTLQELERIRRRLSGRP